MTGRTRFSFVALLVSSGPAFFAFACTSDPATPCTTHDDCAGAKERDDVGTCEDDPTGTLPGSARIVAYCVQGTCNAECATTCDPLSKRCDRQLHPGSVCNLPAGYGSQTAGNCVKAPIPCVPASGPITGADALLYQCPADKPGVGDWTCEEGFCRFPGFEYELP